MKKVTLLLLGIIAWFGLFSQTVLFTDDMESYALNSFLAQSNPTWYDTWSGLPGSGEDAQVVNTFAHSPTKSASVDMTGGATDCLLLLGDKVSGVYTLDWYMYVENNKCAYYNIQHFESPGIEWAFEVYFRTAGTIELLVGGQTINGNYPKATWFLVHHEIDLDADDIKLYINGSLLYQWPFSYQGGSTSGTLQLGAVDFYAGAAQGSGEAPQYFFDDVNYSQVQGGTDPIITVTPMQLDKWLVTGTTGEDSLLVGNIGLSDLDWDINIFYDIDGIKAAPILSAPEYPVKRTLTQMSADPSPNPGGPAGTDATAVLHYDGDNYTAIGWSSAPVTVTVAARFPNAMTIPYAGMEVISVDVYINDLNSSGSNQMTVKIFEGGNSYEPGPLVYQQNFTPAGQNWETITLTTPVMVTGNDLWVGYTFTQNETGIYIPGADGGPANPNGDFLSTGVGWTHLAPQLDYNWNIRANLEGDPIFQWLSADPMGGITPPGVDEQVMATFDATLLLIGQYGATMQFNSNDPVTPQLEVPVTLDVVGVGMDETTKIGVMVYPNPAQNKLNIKTNGTISLIKITDCNGKIVYSGTSELIDISGLTPGTYLVQTQTEAGISNIKFIKK
jgi:hypothetical protein